MNAAQAAALSMDEAAVHPYGVAMSTKEERLAFWYEELEGADYPLVGKKNAR